MSDIKSSGSEELTSVFKTVGQPTVTYVIRGNGKLEADLSRALDENGQLCLISGPSKTGKTTLYREVLRRREEVPLIIRCDRAMTADQVWRKALEEVDFDQVTSRTVTKKVSGTGEVEASGKLGWAWLAQASSRFKALATVGKDDAEIRSRILATPGPDLLIPLLKGTNYRLVIEDFHYLQDPEKIVLFEQWKRFTDNEVSVIVLGTTHRANDIANSNKDLVGRISQINIGNWDIPDLREIAVKGFDYIGVELPEACARTIASEAVGLPIIVQQICLTLVTREGQRYISEVRDVPDVVNPKNVSDSLHEVAIKRYSQFEANYETIVEGPREKARKYKTYEIVLGCFRLDPIKFSMKKSELLNRINALGLTPDETPPPASVTSTLSALAKFQEGRNLELLEWQPSQRVLHITEPAFLFFVRWREKRSEPKSAIEFLELFLESVSKKLKI